MTWRAFTIGLLLVVGLTYLDPFTSFNKGYGWTTSGHFPQGPVFLLVALTLFGNLLLKLISRRAALRQAELMLIWCMLTVACGVASNGMGRYLCSSLAGPSYVAKRADIPWKDTSLEAVPEDLLLTKSPKSLAATRFFETMPDDAQIPWHLWAAPMVRWLVFVMLFYLAVLCMCGLLRKQWVEHERLQFPLARIPLDFTAGSAGPRVLPSIFYNRAFQWGVIITLSFRFLRALPLFFGADAGWRLPVPLNTVFQDTELRYLYFVDFDLWWDVIGFGYIVPADVSLSIWFFYLFGRGELQTSYWMGSTLHYGGTWCELFHWQMAGSYVVFTIGALFMARRHLAAIVRKAFGRGRSVDDSAEPLPFGIGFWGFVISASAAIGWSVFFGMKVWVAVVMLMLFLCIMFVHARIVCQSGLHFTQPLWRPPDVLHGMAYGRAFGARGVVVAHMQDSIAIPLALLGPAAMNAFRISDVFERGKRWFMPAMIVALLAAMVASQTRSIQQGYVHGALNYSDTWGATGLPKAIFDGAHYKMENPSQANQVRWVPLALGAVLTGAVMFMRARFYWWPMHPIGLLAISNWYADRIWLPFLLGWLIKTCFMKFGSGKLVHQARYFFIAAILTEGFIGGISTITRTVSGGDIPGF